MTATFHVGDAIEVMGKLPEDSVDLILTSPPFLALRSYLPADHPDKALEGGSQSTPGEYIDWLIDVVEACDRVLAPHGSLCIELGDTYSGSGGAGGDYAEGMMRDGQPAFIGSARTEAGSRYGADPLRKGTSSRGTGGKDWPLAKSLSLIPELFRLTLVYGTNPLTGRQTDRWRLRNVVRWVRPNPPVGALGDKFRPATSELMVFCKSAKRYFDLDAVREPHKPHTLKYDGQRGDGVKKGNPDRDDAGLIGYSNHPAGAPPLDWWNIPPGGYSGAHYAVMPAELCVKPVKAMSPERVCRVCGEPSRRIVEANRVTDPDDGTRVKASGNTNGWEPPPELGWQYDRTTTGWSSCSHDDWRPGLVLDPFGGSGTTALVATGHGRDCILIDLDARNFELALQRVGPFILSLAGPV